ncbi:hypothetical protein [Streptomyces flavidovirens]
MPLPATAPDQGAAAEAPPTGALSRLVQEANDTGLSYAQMATRSAESGTPLVKQYFQKLAKTPPTSPPNPAQLEAIAAALRKPERRIKEAAAQQWLQYEATELAGYDEEVRIIVGHLAGKSKAELMRWRYMMEAEERAKREAGE